MILKFSICSPGGLKFRFAKDEAVKEEAKKKFCDETLPTFVKHVEKVLENNGGEFLVGKSLTWADIILAVTMSHVKDMFAIDWRPQAAKIAAHQDRVYALPNIKKWIETRPENSM